MTLLALHEEDGRDDEQTEEHADHDERAARARAARRNGPASLIVAPAAGTNDDQRQRDEADDREAARRNDLVPGLTVQPEQEVEEAVPLSQRGDLRRGVDPSVPAPKRVPEVRVQLSPRSVTTAPLTARMTAATICDRSKSTRPTTANTTSVASTVRLCIVMSAPHAAPRQPASTLRRRRDACLLDAAQDPEA